MARGRTTILTSAASGGGGQSGQVAYFNSFGEVTSDSSFTYTANGGPLNLNGSFILGANAATGVTLVKDAANTLAQRNGVNAQVFRIFNTTDGAGNDEYMSIGYVQSNRMQISSNKDGTGTLRALDLVGSSMNLFPSGSSGDSTGRWNLQTGSLAPQGDNAVTFGDVTHRISNAWTVAVTTSVSTVAALPAAPVEGMRAAVRDSNAASFTAGIGAVVAAGGSTHVPVYYDGTNWRIG